GMQVTVWYGVVAPAATPRDIVQTLAAAIARATQDAEMRRRMLEQGAEPVGSTPEEFGKLLHAEVARWAEVVKVSGARAD
ncbi:MAG: tripartite tricarboxylate transporter substrate-binding protein, partial [Burkholderiales bacterium]